MCAQRTKDWFKPTERKFELFCFAFFQVIHNCVSAHSNSFSEASPDIRCSLKAQVSVVFEPATYQSLNIIYECHCLMDENRHDCTPSGNSREGKLKCRKSTKCSLAITTRYKCDLEITRTQICCDDDFTIDGSDIPSTFTCKVKGCPQNSKSGETGRYHKKAVATLNPNGQQILIFCKFLRCIDSKMITLKIGGLQPKNN